MAAPGTTTPSALHDDLVAHIVSTPVDRTKLDRKPRYIDSLEESDHVGERAFTLTPIAGPDREPVSGWEWSTEYQVTLFYANVPGRDVIVLTDSRDVYKHLYNVHSGAPGITGVIDIQVEESELTVDDNDIYFSRRFTVRYVDPN